MSSAHHYRGYPWRGSHGLDLRREIQRSSAEVPSMSSPSQHERHSALHRARAPAHREWRRPRRLTNCRRRRARVRRGRSGACSPWRDGWRGNEAPRTAFGRRQSRIWPATRCGRLSAAGRRWTCGSSNWCSAPRSGGRL